MRSFSTGDAFNGSLKNACDAQGTETIMRESIDARDNLEDFDGKLGERANGR